MDLYVDQDYLMDGSKKLLADRDRMEQLETEISASFQQLRQEWDSEAGRMFFEKFENDLLKNLKQYVAVFEHMSRNLSAASQKYEEIFKAVETVALAQY